MTKLNLFILAILMLLALPLHAQWNIGGVFDINIASISVGSDHDISWLRLGLETKGEYSSHTAFGLGVVLDRQLSSQIDLHFEPMLLQKGATIKGWQIEVILKTVYIELPAMLRYNLQSGGSFRPYIIAGPCLGFRLSAKWDIKDGGGTN